jgi:phosphoribosylglycinamide formyltransferase-1
VEEINMDELPVLGILISGRGTNAMAIADSVDAGKIQARIGIVISDKHGAAGLEKAKARGIPTSIIQCKHRLREEHDREIVGCLRDHAVSLVCLAGYMRLLSPYFVDAFRWHILNIHPALLPSFPGHNPHEDTIKHGVKISGCTVHLVDENVDNGPIVVQRPVQVLDTDTAETLSARILPLEWEAYTEAINIMLAGGWKIEGRRFVRG